MTLPNGYKMESTFWDDFSIADMFGVPAIRDTYKRAFKEWKTNYIYLTELVIVLNLKLWDYYERGNKTYAAIYNELWQEADAYACDTLTGEEATFFFTVTD